MRQNIQRGERLHIPVLSKEVIESLKPQTGDSYLDLTAGYGGHTELVLAITNNPQQTTLVDRDDKAIAVLTDKFPDSEILHTDFLKACQDLTSQGRQYDMILADLGVSSPHLDNPERGFAFKTDGPLDMRMDQRQQLTAATLVNQSSESELAEIIKKYGEDPKAKAIARTIVNNRPFTTTAQLAQIIDQEHGRKFRPRKVHPATLTFQALRIVINDELTQVEQGLKLMESLLAPGGRLAIISFHSLEDRIVKRYFVENAGDRYDAELRLLTKKPVVASTNELVLNPRARSAKLRAAVKIKNRKEL